jgi:hypothetical protein
MAESWQHGSLHWLRSLPVTLGDAVGLFEADPEAQAAPGFSLFL